VKEQWRKIAKAVNRTVIPHDVKYYQELQKKRYAWLLSDEQQGKAVRAEQAGHLGKGLQKLVEELLNHPLCQRLTQKPDIFVYKDFGSNLGTFGNIILVPFYEWPGEHDQPRLHKLRAALAHELGHMICADSEPTEQARHPHRDMNQSMERRADLIAAHLCGDGGEALAEWFAGKLKDEKEFQRCADRKTSWLDRVADRIVGGLDRRYPSLETRIQYLRKWADRFQKGQPLPDIDIPDRSHLLGVTLDASPSADLGR
jgi:hypothetical protein